MKKMAEPKECGRCGSKAYQLYEHNFEDDCGEKRKIMVCWDCDFDVINGGEMMVDEGELLMEREEQEYLDDPINNPEPRWMR